MSNTAVTLFFCERYYFCQKMQIFCKKLLTLAKSRESLYQKVYFLKLNMSVYLRTSFYVCSIILMSFREGVIVARPPSQNEPLKSLLRLGLICYRKNKKKIRNRNCYKKRVRIIYKTNLFLRKMNHLLVLIPTPSQLTYKRINRFHLKLSSLKKFLTIITPITY